MQNRGAAANPVEFPAFTRNEGRIESLPVMCSDGVYQRNGLRSTSGRCYELGRVLRDAIYGK